MIDFISAKHETLRSENAISKSSNQKNLSQCVKKNLLKGKLLKTKKVDH